MVLMFVYCMITQGCQFFLFPIFCTLPGFPDKIANINPNIVTLHVVSTDIYKCLQTPVKQQIILALVSYQHIVEWLYFGPY